jgi:hypothetical protein
VIKWDRYWRGWEGHQKRLRVQLWWQGWRRAWWDLRRWAWARKTWEVPWRPWLSLSHRRSNWYCYCPQGSLTECVLRLPGLTLRLTYSRDWIRRPCICDRVSYSLHPEDYPDDVEDYGEARLRAEFPDLWKRHDREREDAHHA